MQIFSFKHILWTEEDSPPADRKKSVSSEWWSRREVLTLQESVSTERRKTGSGCGAEAGRPDLKALIPKHNITYTFWLSPDARGLLCAGLSWRPPASQSRSAGREQAGCYLSHPAGQQHLPNLHLKVFYRLCWSCVGNDISFLFSFHLPFIL